MHTKSNLDVQVVYSVLASPTGAYSGKSELTSSWLVVFVVVKKELEALAVC